MICLVSSLSFVILILIFSQIQRMRRRRLAAGRSLGRGTKMGAKNPPAEFQNETLRFSGNLRPTKSVLSDGFLQLATQRTGKGDLHKSTVFLFAFNIHGALFVCIQHEVFIWPCRLFMFGEYTKQSCGSFEIGECTTFKRKCFEFLDSFGILSRVPVKRNGL